MLAHEAAGFRAQLEDRERRRVVHEERLADEVFHLIVQLPPLVGRELSALDFLALNLADVHNHAVH